MAMELYFSGTTAENDYNQNEIPLKCKSMKMDKSEGNNNASDSMDCNICLDLVQDPVVTFCGHLYCWPCIYKWIHFQSDSSQQTDHQPPHCPVCKAEISQETMIPLYGKGLTTEPSKGKAFHLDLDIPQRPQSPRHDANQRIVYSPTGIANRVPQLSSLSPRPQQAQPYHDYTRGGGDGAVTNMSQLGMTMFGEMVYARIFGNSESETRVYAYPNSYNTVCNNPRIRRHLMEADKSLSRLTFFIMCCMLLCLLLF